MDYTKQSLLIIINNKGFCTGVRCYSSDPKSKCPLHKVCRGDFKDKYKKAIEMYLRFYGKEDLVEVLI